MRLCHVALLGDQVVGCAYGEQLGRTFAIQAVAVLSEYQGRRIATYLLGALLTRARANGCSNATVLTPGHPVFFARCGFTLTAPNNTSREMQLSRGFLRRFGARVHFLCRPLD
jgi:amino-acid N-acetyltransferase